MPENEPSKYLLPKLFYDPRVLVQLRINSLSFRLNYSSQELVNNGMQARPNKAINTPTDQIIVHMLRGTVKSVYHTSATVPQDDERQSGWRDIYEKLAERRP